MDTMGKDEKATTLSEEEAEIGHSPVLAWYYYATADTNRNLAASCALLRTIRDRIQRQPTVVARPCPSAFACFLPRSMTTNRDLLPARTNPAVRDLEGLLDTTWRVTLKSDERVFVGKFMVVDREVRLRYDTLSRLT